MTDLCWMMWLEFFVTIEDEVPFHLNVYLIYPDDVTSNIDGEIMPFTLQ